MTKPVVFTFLGYFHLAIGSAVAILSMRTLLIFSDYLAYMASWGYILPVETTRFILLNQMGLSLLLVICGVSLLKRWKPSLWLNLVYSFLSLLFLAVDLLVMNRNHIYIPRGIVLSGALYPAITLLLVPLNARVRRFLRANKEKIS